jgi:hypothetical protein
MHFLAVKTDMAAFAIGVGEVYSGDRIGSAGLQV